MQVVQVPVPRPREPWLDNGASAQALDSGSARREHAHAAPLPSLQAFLQHAGALFGCDPGKWERQGRIRTDYSEADGVRCLSSATPWR